LGLESALPDGMDAVRTILFLDKVFLKRKRDPLRGVELFNLNLLRDLLRLGYRVRVVADRSWKDTLFDSAAPYRPDMVLLGALGMEFMNGLFAGFRLARASCDVLLLGNVGNGILWLVNWLRRLKVFSRCVLIAHREASARFVKVFKSLPGHVVCVNGKIAEPFRKAGHPGVHVDYGIFGADLFQPKSEADPAKVHFCVMGMLDNAWKGADTAVEAFRMMPDSVRQKCVLHLASFTSPPSYPEKNIVAYDWMAPEKIPAWLRTMDVMLCPSRDEEVMRETFSQAVVQGMLTALPVIASDRPIFIEKFDQGGGFIFHTAGELSQLMRKLAGDATLRAELGRQGRKTALERYVWDTERFAQRYIEG
jgi:glycosyltransferase involved in cell wall biosynthesis